MTEKLFDFQFAEKEAAYLYDEIHRIKSYVGVLGTNPEPYDVCSKFCEQYQSQIKLLQSEQN